MRVWLADKVNGWLARWGIWRPMPMYTTWEDVRTFATYQQAQDAAAELAYITGRVYVGVERTDGRWDIRRR